MKPSISQENKKIIKFLTTIILIIIIIIIIYISCVCVNSELYEYVYPHVQNDMHMNFINYLVDGIICVLGSYIGFYISDKYINKKKSLAEIDSVLCPMYPEQRDSKKKEVKAAGETKGGNIKGGLDIILKNEKELLNSLITELNSENNNQENFKNIIRNINNLNGTQDEDKIQFDKYGLRQDDPGVFFRLFKSIDISAISSDYKYNENMVNTEKGRIWTDEEQSRFYINNLRNEYEPYKEHQYILYTNNDIEDIKNIRGNIDMLKNEQFQLIGAIEHMGNIIRNTYGQTISGGHYIAHVLREIDGKEVIFKCSDSSIMENTKHDSIIKAIENKRIKFLLFKLKNKPLNKTRPIPLYNKGNTCFIASALQILLSTDLLDNDIPREDKSNKKIDDETINDKIEKLNKIKSKIIEIKTNKNFDFMGQRTVTAENIKIINKIKKIYKDIEGIKNIETLSKEELNRLILQLNGFYYIFLKLIGLRESKDADYQENMQILDSLIEYIEDYPQHIIDQFESSYSTEETTITQKKDSKKPLLKLNPDDIIVQKKQEPKQQNTPKQEPSVLSKAASVLSKAASSLSTVASSVVFGDTKEKEPKLTPKLYHLIMQKMQK